MVGFNLGEILGKSIELSQPRIERMQAAFAAALLAFRDMRFNDARDHVAEIKGEIDAVELLLEVNGYTDEAKDP